MKIKVNRSNGRVYLPDKYLARDNDNLVQTFEVEFDDEFLQGIGQLDYILPSGEKGYINMELNEQTYSVPIYNSICKEGILDLQFLVFLNARFIKTSDEEINPNHTYFIKEGDTYVEVENPTIEDIGEYYVQSVPLYHSKMFTLTVDPSINAELEENEQYPTKIALINAKLKEVEDALDDMSKAIEDCEEATSDAEKVNISQTKSNHIISITTTNRNGVENTQTLQEEVVDLEKDGHELSLTKTDSSGTDSISWIEPTASVSKVGKVSTLTINDGDGTTSVDVKDGANFEYNWQGTSLGVKTDEEQEYEYVDLKGEKGDTGDAYFSTFSINEDAHLIMHRPEELTQVMFSLDSNGHLIESMVI